MAKRYITRLGKPKSYVTVGKTYELDRNDQITFDDGDTCEPIIDDRWSDIWDGIKPPPQIKCATFVGKSNQHWVRGDTYTFRSDGAILDMQGNWSSSVSPWNHKRWQLFTDKPITPLETAAPEAAPVYIGIDVAKHGSDSMAYMTQTNGHPAPNKEFEIEPTEWITSKEKKMLKIENDTRIDGIHESDYATGRIIDLIEEEQVCLKRIEGMTLTKESKAIAKLAAKHVDNIAALIEVLDARED